VIKRTLYFGNPAYLTVKNSNLIVRYPNDGGEKKAHIEDIGVLILDNSQITLTQPVLNALLANNVAVLTCDAKHLPLGLFLNLNGHHKQQEHWHTQVAVSDAKKARLWKQLIKSKITNQATLMEGLGYEVNNMRYWANQVSNGDPENYEARAAAFYWKFVFTDYVSNFKRGRYEADPNHFLNYGYAILRAVVARSLVASGLLPAFGIHHRNSYNAYCLADDVMEPYRPLVDSLVLELLQEGLGFEELTPAVKLRLLQIPVIDVAINKKQSPLMLAVQQTTASVYACYTGERKKLKLPQLS
jgi:CRISPR-associated protein Cas1